MKFSRINLRYKEVSNSKVHYLAVLVCYTLSWVSSLLVSR